MHHCEKKNTDFSVSLYCVTIDRNAEIGFNAGVPGPKRSMTQVEERQRPDGIQDFIKEELI
jgi:hypothetical protein